MKVWKTVIAIVLAALVLGCGAVKAPANDRANTVLATTSATVKVVNGETWTAKFAGHTGTYSFRKPVTSVRNLRVTRSLDGFPVLHFEAQEAGMSGRTYQVGYVLLKSMTYQYNAAPDYNPARGNVR